MPKHQSYKLVGIVLIIIILYNIKITILVLHASDNICMNISVIQNPHLLCTRSNVVKSLLPLLPPVLLSILIDNHLIKFLHDNLSGTCTIHEYCKKEIHLALIFKLLLAHFLLNLLPKLFFRHMMPASVCSMHALVFLTPRAICKIAIFTLF